MATAQSGQEHIHDNPMPAPPPIQSTASRVAAKNDDAEERANGSIKLASHDLDLGEDRVGLRFTNVAIPAGATIVKAYIEFEAQESSDEPTSLIFHGEDVDDAGQFTHEHGDISGRSMTSASVNWPAVPAWAAGEKFWSPNLASILQEIVSRSGWAKGNDLAILITGAGDRDAWSYDGKPGAAPLLYVEYQMSGLAAASTAGAISGAVSSTILGGGENADSSEVPAIGPDEDDLEGEVQAQNSKLFIPVVQR
jgi:hypothetical protein